MGIFPRGEGAELLDDLNSELSGDPKRAQERAAKLSSHTPRLS